MDDFDRLPPHSSEAEQCVIGAMMIASDDSQVSEITSEVSRDDFYRADHQELFDAIMQLRREGSPVDAVTLRSRLIDTGRLEAIGGVAYLAELLNAVPSAQHGPHYGRIVREKALGRAIIKLAGEVMAKAWRPCGEAYATILEKTCSDMLSLASRGSVMRIRRHGEVAMDWYESTLAGKNAPRVMTGLLELDDTIGGFPLGGFTQIWARPRMGKSALIKSVAALQGSAGTSVGIISVEESEQKIATNIVASRAGVNSWLMQQSRLSAKDLEQSLNAINESYRWPIYIADQPVRLSEVESVAAMMVNRHQCRVIYVDHIHIIDAEVRSHENRTQEISKISGRLKALAKRLNIALVAACQVKRSGEKGKEQPPTLESGRDSGALEQDGDIIIGLHREDVNRLDQRHLCDHQMQARVLKNKGGREGIIPLYFDGDHQRVSDWQGGSSAV